MFKKIAWTTLVVILLEVTCVAAVMWATSPLVFYAGQHDGQCEKVRGEHACKCHQRLVSADSENFHK